MGGGQSNDKNSQKSLSSCLLYLVEDFEFYIDKTSLNYLEANKMSFSSKFEKNRKRVIDQLKQSIPPQITLQEDILQNYASSVFQCSLITKNNYKLRNVKQINMDKEFVKAFRLMSFSDLRDHYENIYQNNLSELYQGLKSYCTLANFIIKQLDKKLEVQCKLYILIWEHFQNHLCKLSNSDIYDLQSINQFFNDNYATLNPPLKIEILGAKLWGTLVQQLNIDYIIEQFRITRKNPEKQEIKLSKAVNALIDMNINAVQIQYLGISNFQFDGNLKILIDFIIQDTNILYNELIIQTQGNLLQFLDSWEQDDKFMKSVLPIWICENILNTQFFSFFEKRINEKIKLLQKSEQINLIQKYTQKIEQIDFQSQLNKSIGNLQSIYFQFDNFQMENMDSTLQIVIKQLKSEIDVSSILLDSKKTQQGPSDQLIQQNSNLFSDSDIDVYHVQSNVVDIQDQYQSEKSQLLMGAEDEIARICKRYDDKKNIIQLNIKQRDEKIKNRNKNLLPLSHDLEQIFSFVHPLQKSVDEIVKILLDKRSKEINTINNDQFVIQGRSVADELLLLLGK